MRPRSSGECFPSIAMWAMPYVGHALEFPVRVPATRPPVIGLDYYMTQLENLRGHGDNSQNNLRYRAGLNFTFGGAR
jgi:hypothetical protein